jgi:hypothetical protein
MRRRLFVVLAVVCGAGLAPAPLHAQEYPLVADHAPSWSAPDVRGASLPPAARTAALAVAAQILDIIKRMPIMAPTPGFQVVQHTFLSEENIDHSENPHLPRLVTIQVTANLAPYERLKTAVEANERDTAGSVTIVVNDFDYTGTTLMGEGWSDDKGGFIQDPEEPVETRHGFPVYQEGNLDKWLLMRRHNVPVLSPLSRERYLLCLTKQVQDNLAKVEERRAKIPASVPSDIVATVDDAIAHGKAHVANLQRQYQGMSTDDRTRVAVVGSSEGDDPVAFVGAGEGNAFYTFNPALVDPALPPATPQALSIRLLSNEDLFAGLGEKLEQQLDWDALARLVR